MERNSSPVAQSIASVADKTPNWFFLLISVVALIFALLMWADARSMRNEVQNIRLLLERQINSADQAAAQAARSAVEAAVANERADKAERHAAISEINAKQIYVELNRLGYPVLTPAEPHPMEPIGHVADAEGAN